MDTAVKFLKNPKIAPSSMATKRAFLKSKGMSDDEINQACQLAGVSTDDAQCEFLPIFWLRAFTSVVQGITLTMAQHFKRSKFRLWLPFPKLTFWNKNVQYEEEGILL